MFWGAGRRSTWPRTDSPLWARSVGERTCQALPDAKTIKLPISSTIRAASRRDLEFVNVYLAQSTEHAVAKRRSTFSRKRSSDNCAMDRGHPN